MNILKCFTPKYFTVSCRPNTLLMQAWSYVEFVLSNLFQRINIVFELLQDEKMKSHALWESMKREFLG